MGREVKTVWLGADSMITSLGLFSGEVLAAIGEGRTGCRTIHDPALWGGPFVAGRIDREMMPGLPGFTPLESIFIAAIGDVVRSSGIDPAADDTALVIASTKGNIELLSGAAADVDNSCDTDEGADNGYCARTGAADERVYIGNMARRVATRCGFTAMPIVISNACISGVSALIVAARLIREGRCRNVVVAGGDTLTRFVVTGFHAFRSVSGAVCRPYDAARDGLTLGEGCGAVLLTSERARATEPCIEIAGGSVSADANHISGPSRTGDGLFFAIRDAMAEAGITPSEVGFVNGHGTGTVFNDEMESKAFALAGLDAVPVGGLKPYFGHTLGAAGVVETIVSAHALRTGTVYGTPGFAEAGTPHPLDVSSRHRTTGADVCVKTASGFGGSNAAIVLRKSDSGSGSGSVKCAPDPREPVALEETPEPNIRQTAAASILPDGRPFGEMIRERFRTLGSPDMKFFRMDDLSRLAYVAAGELLRAAGLFGEGCLHEKYRPDRIGIVLSNRSASLDSDARHYLQIEMGDGEASPAVFVYTLPNVCAGEVSIRHKIQGEITFFIEDGPGNANDNPGCDNANGSPDDPNDSGTFAEDYARMLLRRGHLEAVICGRCELFGEDFEAKMILLETK